MRTCLSLVLGFVAAVLFAPTHEAQAQDKSLTFITGNDFKPFTDEALPEGGLITSLIRTVLENQDYDVDFEFRDAWAEVYDTAAAQEYAGTFPYYYRVRRARDFAYSEPMFSETQFAFFRSDASMPSDVPGLAGTTMCYPQGYAIPPNLVDYVQNGQIRHEVPNTMLRCFELLALNRVDFVLAGKLQGFQLIDSVPDFSRDQARVTDFVITANDHHLIIAHDLPNREQIVADFNTGLRQLKATGEYKEIVNRFLPGWDETPPPSRVARAGVVSRYDVTLLSGRSFQANVEEIEEGLFRLETEFGPIELSHREVQNFEEVASTAGAVTTASTTAADAADLALSAPGTAGSMLIPALAEGFAVSSSGSTNGWVDEDANRKRVAVNGSTANLGSMAIQLGSPEEALSALLSGQSNVALSDRPVTPAENQAAISANLGNLQTETAEKVIALEAAAAISHPRNRVRSLTYEQLIDIFNGRIRNWSQVGGAAGPIQIVAPAATTGAGQLLRQAVLAGGNLPNNATEVGSVEAVATAVAGDPFAIGFAPVTATGNARALLINRCGVLLAPTSFQVKTEEYPFIQRLYMYAPQNTDNRHVGPFVAFAESDEGQKIVSDLGFVDLQTSKQTSDDFALHRQRLALMGGELGIGVERYLATVNGSGRSSITFRFRTGSSTLDARGLSDIRRAANYLRNTQSSGEVTLVGFADARGSAAANLNLSRARAEEVAQALRAELPNINVSTVEGFGEAMPVACNTDETGWSLNRRVELWVR